MVGTTVGSTFFLMVPEIGFGYGTGFLNELGGCHVSPGFGE